MKKILCLALPLAALLVAPACGDDGGSEDNPAFISAFPNTGFTGRTSTVALIGEDTAWTSGSTVDFGADITVVNVMAVGSTGLIVEISAAPEAAEGPRSVTVDGDTLANGFTLEAPILAVIQGRVGQGGLAIVDVENLDLANPFDTTLDANSDFANLSVTVPGGSGFIADATATTMNFTLAVDIAGAPGAVNVEITSGGVKSIIPVTIEATTPTPLTGLTQSGSIGGAFDTKVFEVTAAELSTFAMHPALGSVAEGNTIVFAIGAGGSFDTDFLGSASVGFFGPTPFTTNLAPTEKIFLVVWDNAGTPAYDFAFDAVLSPLTNTITETEPNDTSATAQALTLPGGVIDGLLNNADPQIDDEDFFSVTIGAGDAGKGLSVATAATNADPSDFVDTAIEILDSDGTTVLAASADGGIYDAVLSGPLAEGTYFIRVFFAFGSGSEGATFNTAASLVTLPAN